MTDDLKWAETLGKSANQVNRVIARLTRENDELRTALNFYAEEDRYDYDETCCPCYPTKKRRVEIERSGGDVLQDNGNIARKALNTEKDTG